MKSPTNGPARKEVSEEVVDYSEVSPGIYFPKQVVIEEKLGGDLEFHKTVTFSAVKVNAPLAADLFKP